MTDRPTGTDNGIDLLLRYGRLAATGPWRRGGSELPNRRLERRVRTDPEQLTRYAHVCGFDLGNQLPPTFPHVLAFGDTLRLLALPDFPFPAIGLVHVANRIEHRRPIGLDEELTMRSGFGELTEHHRGQQFDILVEASVGDAVVWRSTSRYLHPERPGRFPSRANAPHPEPTPVRPTARWSIPADIGRRYAAVSADPNPIHLHPAGALLAGRRRPIAHGMCLMARCLAALTGRLPAAYGVDVDFRRPVRVPSQLGFAAWVVPDQPAADGWDFQLQDLSVTESSSVRVSGSVRRLGAGSDVPD